jgi:hypothetical protein
MPYDVAFLLEITAGDKAGKSVPSELIAPCGHNPRLEDGGNANFLYMALPLLEDAFAEPWKAGGEGTIEDH